MTSQAREAWNENPQTVESVAGYNPQGLTLFGDWSDEPQRVRGAEVTPDLFGKLGVIEEGAYADMVLVDGNPLEDISLLRDYTSNFKLIMKDGQIWKNTLN